MRQAVWVRSDATRIDPDGPVPLVSYGEDCACQRVAVAALSQAGRRCDFVFTSVSLTSLAAAVGAGFGVLVMPRGRALRNNLYIWEDAPLPPLPQLFAASMSATSEAAATRRGRARGLSRCGPAGGAAAAELGDRRITDRRSMRAPVQACPGLSLGASIDISRV